MADEKEIRIKIKSVRYEVEASLFAGADDEETITLRASDDDGAPETIEINTVGKLRKNGDCFEVLYEETEATGMEGTSSSVSFMRSQSVRILSECERSLSRSASAISRVIPLRERSVSSSASKTAFGVLKCARRYEPSSLPTPQRRESHIQ